MGMLFGGHNANFADPIALMQECHRRIERFLGMLAAIAAIRDRELDGEELSALATAIQYFAEAGAQHRQDEEESLFPRLCASEGPEIAAALDACGDLERDHGLADPLHAEAETLGRRWLQTETLPPAQRERFVEVVGELIEIYREHIHFEDNVLFPLARRVLPEDVQRDMGRELAQRRNIDPSRSHVGRLVPRG